MNTSKHIVRAQFLPSRIMWQPNYTRQITENATWSNIASVSSSLPPDTKRMRKSVTPKDEFKYQWISSTPMCPLSTARKFHRLWRPRDCKFQCMIVSLMNATYYPSSSSRWITQILTSPSHKIRRLRSQALFVTSALNTAAASVSRNGVQSCRHSKGHSKIKNYGSLNAYVKVISRDFASGY